LAKKSLIAKAKLSNKFKARNYNRCPLCGRPELTSVSLGSAVSASETWR